ncbi:MAG: hypothetical protein V4696_03530 [Pseudomonadota bacterium]
MIVAIPNPAKIHEKMATLWAGATKLNLTPVAWRAGFFAHRAVISVHEGETNWRVQPFRRIESAWGAAMDTVAFDDSVELVAQGELPGHHGNFHIITIADGKNDPVGIQAFKGS